MKTANGYLRIACWVFNALILIRLFKQNALDLCSTSLSLIRMGIVSMRGWFGRLLYQGDFHFLRGLDLELLNLSFGTFIIEIEVPDKTIFFKDKFIYSK